MLTHLQVWGVQLSGQRLQQGALAGPRGSQHEADAVGGDGPRDGVQDGEPAAVGAQDAELHQPLLHRTRHTPEPKA